MIEIEKKKAELNKQLRELEKEELRLQGRHGTCVKCGEEKQFINTDLFINTSEKTCYDCDRKRRQRETDELYSKFIGKKIVKINAEPRHAYSIDPDIFSIELEGGYEITVASWAAPRAMGIEKI